MCDCADDRNLTIVFEVKDARFSRSHGSEGERPGLSSVTSDLNFSDLTRCCLRHVAFAPRDLTMAAADPAKRCASSKKSDDEDQRQNLSQQDSALVYVKESLSRVLHSRLKGQL